MTRAYNIAVVGATGIVGEEFLKILSKRQFPLGKLRLIASARSAGKKIDSVFRKLPSHQRGCDA